MLMENNEKVLWKGRPEWIAYGLGWFLTVIFIFGAFFLLVKDKNPILLPLPILTFL